MTLDALRQALVAQGGTLADTLTAAPDGAGAPGTAAADAVPPVAAGPPQVAARGPRATGREPEYELLLEMILEGSLLHYGSPRLIACRDPDLALLLGDQLYALGLSRLAALGDLDAVAELADLISLLAQAQAAQDPALVDAIWRSGAAAIGWGTTPSHEAAKALVRAGDGGATLALARAYDDVLAQTGQGR